METGSSIFRRHDGRLGLGYGQIQNRFHAPRKLASAFPYFDDDPYSDDDFEDLDTELVIAKKIQKKPVGGKGDRKSAGPFYFVAGNTKLVDCFFSIDRVLLEVHAMANSMVSIPNLYKGPKVGSGSTAYITGKSFKRSGSKAGFSSAPPPANDKEDENQLYYGGFLLILPYIILLLSAYFIKKDEKLVRSADRIR